MFKVGDIVEITDESDSTGMLDFTQGHPYRVHKTRPSEYGGHLQVFMLSDSGATGWYHQNHFKLKEDIKVEKKECLFKEGQVVWDLIEGSCVVEALVDGQEEYCVKVRFKDGEWDYYTVDGKLHVDDNVRRLFFSEPKIEAATEPVFEPTLKEGDVVVLSNREADYIATVVSEDEGSIYYNTADGVVTYVDKSSVIVYRLGEKINFK